MLDSVPVPLQAILWPLAGAVIALTAGRLLPNWFRRIVALAATLASFAALWSLRGGGIERVEIFWEPLNFFRLNPTLVPDSLSLLVGLTLTGAVAASVLGIQGSETQNPAWHGLVLVALAGCLTTTMAANLPTLALGSALIDLAWIAMIASSPGASDPSDRPPMGIVVTGTLSTLVLFFGALEMSTQTGTTSLLARGLPVGVLTMVGVAGLLRLMVFPLHPRKLSTPESAAAVILPIGTGIYLLARTQTIAPILVDQRWMLIAGGAALAAGGLLTWADKVDLAGPLPQAQDSCQTFWPGIVAYQTGFVLLSVLFFGTSVPWPLIGLALILGMMAIWWDGNLAEQTPNRPPWLERIVQQTQPWRSRLSSYTGGITTVLERWRESWFGRHGLALLPTVALASLAGAPLTVGAPGRWAFYAALLDRGEATLLMVVLAADCFLAAGLWTALGALWTQTDRHRLKPTAFLAMVTLAVLAIALGIAPGSLSDQLGLELLDPPDVSVWGLGLIFVLPWLLGLWLARVGTHIERYLCVARSIINLDWFYRAATWAGQQLAGAIYWLGQVGEGEGWWGWALIILALGTILLTTH